MVWAVSERLWWFQRFQAFYVHGGDNPLAISYTCKSHPKFLEEHTHVLHDSELKNGRRGSLQPETAKMVQHFTMV